MKYIVLYRLFFFSPLIYVVLVEEIVWAVLAE